MANNLQKGQSAQEVEKKLSAYLASVRERQGSGGMAPSWWADGPGVSPAMNGNSIEPLIDGELYFRRLLADLEAARHYVLIIGFSLNSAFQLARPSRGQRWRSDEVQSVRLWSVVKRITERRANPVNVRIIVWSGVGAFIGSNSDNVPSRIAKTLSLVGDRCRVLLYDKISTFGSLHQKAVVVDGRVAFCGGLDITDDKYSDRWDTRSHYKDDPRRRRNAMSWHDVQVRMEGPAVGAIQENFRRRWEYQSGRPLEIQLRLPSQAATELGCAAQVIRTIPRTSRHDASEFSEFESWGRAIVNARELIYIENQYFSCTELFTLLDACLYAKPRLHLIVLLPPRIEPAMAEYAGEFHESGIQPSYVMKMLARGKSNRVFFACPVSSSGHDVYVHAKLMIVDDTYATVGSANFNRRAMVPTRLIGGEEEIGVAWVDAKHGTVRRFREDLWAEHLQMEPKILAEPTSPTGEQLFKLWRSRSGVARIRHFPL